MNLKKAIADWMLNDTDINSIVGDRVYRNKAIITDTTPLVVYSLEKSTNKIGEYLNSKGYLAYTLIIDIVGKYEEQDNLELVRTYIRNKLGGFNGILTTDWQGRISIIDIVDLYDEKTDLFVYRIELLAKEKFK